MRDRLLALHEFWLPRQEQWPSEEDAKRWFSGGKEFDNQLKENYTGLVEDALAGKGQEFATDDRLIVALILTLDQLPRNIYRGAATAFLGDSMAQTMTLDLLGTEGRIMRLWPAERMFALMPLMHAEDIALQEEGVRRFTELGQQCPPELEEFAASQVKFAMEHRDIVARFGRFPYRNKALGRETSPQEQQWIDDSGISYGQG